MYDPYLHLFLDPAGVGATQHLYRRVNPLRRETLTPVLAPDGAAEGTAIGYATAIFDPQDGLYKLWYMNHHDFAVRLATSPDARTWERRGVALEGMTADNLALVPVGPGADGWFAGARFAGYGYANRGELHGLHLLRSMDGARLEARQPGILPGVGDRASLMLDEVTGRYSLICRPSGQLPGFRKGELARPRLANLWTSADLLCWDNHGIVLRYDEQDPADVEIYGMVPFRCGAGFAAFVEVYHRGIERLDTQLAWSDDGLCWQRVQPRAAVLGLGGDGAWDSHWAVPTNNPPLAAGDRLLVLYSAAGTKHGSGARHQRAIGLASIRRDGWLSMEAGRTEGVLVTAPLPLEQPMQLEVNADCRTGYLSVEVQSPAGEQVGAALPGYDAAAGRQEAFDGVRVPIRWGERAVVDPVPGGRCVLRFAMQQASLFGYRWQPA